MRPTLEADHEVAKSSGFESVNILPKGLTHPLKAVECAASLNAAKRSLTIYQAKQTVWALTGFRQRKASLMREPFLRERVHLTNWKSAYRSKIF
jgi:hypothetical protein